MNVVGVQSKDITCLGAGVICYGAFPSLRISKFQVLRSSDEIYSRYTLSHGSEFDFVKHNENKVSNRWILYVLISGKIIIGPFAEWQLPAATFIFIRSDYDT